MERRTSSAPAHTDPVVTGAFERIRTDFPWASQLVLESHLTLLRASAVYAEVLAQGYGDLGLSSSRFNLLWLLYRTEGHRLSIGGLADHIGITAPSVMKMVQLLEKEGWVETAKGTSDRRVTFTELSTEGEKRFAALLDQTLRRWEAMWKGLDDGEKTVLISLLAKLRGSLLSTFLGSAGLAAFRAGRRAPSEDAGTHGGDRA